MYCVLFKRDNLYVWGYSFLFFLIVQTLLLSGCGDSDDSISPRAIEALNQACIKGQISGEFVVKMSDGSFKAVTAASKKHLLKKVKNFKLHAVSFERNFKVNSDPILPKLNTDSQRSYDHSEGPKFINADFLWNKGFKGAGVVTALIDSGYDFNHQILKETVFENLRDLGEDEDDNGYKGDRFGWDTFNDRPLKGDLGRHGTHIGSVIAGNHSNKIKLSVAPESKIVPIAALQPREAGETDATGDSNSIIAAIDYAISRNVDFINASWGGDSCSDFIRDRIKSATDQGIIFVTSAGNSGSNLDQKTAFPASLTFPSLLTVGASNLDRSRERNSSYGVIVDFFALGRDVVVASPQNQLGSVTGTSVATPFITGGMALLKNAFPEASNEALIKAMRISKSEHKIPNLEVAYRALEEL